MANTWIKLYHEILTDPKMGRMSDKLFRRTIELFLIAGKEDNDGILPSIEDISWILRTSDKEIQKTIEDLEALNIVKRDGGVTVVTHFCDRQNTQLSDAERQAKSRANKKLSQSNCDTSHTDVTEGCDTCHKKVTLDKDKEEDKEIDKDINTHTNVCVLTPAKNPEKPKRKNSRDRDRGELKNYGFAKNVLLSDEEYANLQKTVGDGLESLIDDFSIYLGKTPKYGEQYPDHYFDLLSWHRKDVRDKKKADVPVQPREETWQEVAARMQREREAREGVIDL